MNIFNQPITIFCNTLVQQDVETTCVQGAYLSPSPGSSSTRLDIPDHHYSRRPSAQCEHIRVKITPGTGSPQVVSAQQLVPVQYHHRHRSPSNASVSANGQGTNGSGKDKDLSPQSTPKNIYQHRRPSRQLEPPGGMRGSGGVGGGGQVHLDPGHASTARRLSRTSIDSGQMLMAAVRRASHQIDPADVQMFAQTRR